MIPENYSFNEFATAFEEVAQMVRDNAVEKGFYEQPREDGTAIALIHSELSEALEAIRAGDTVSNKIPLYSMVEEELADAVIRIMDFAKHKRLRLASAIAAKMRYNQTRPQKHGKKF